MHPVHYYRAQIVRWYVKMEVPSVLERVYVNVQMASLGLLVEVSAGQCDS